MVKNKAEKDAKWHTFLYHFLIFVGVHVWLTQYYELIPLNELNSVNYWTHIHNHFFQHGVNIFVNSTINQMSAVWKSVLIVHFIIELVASLFPKKKKTVQAKMQLEHKPLDQEKGSASRAWLYLIVAGLLEIAWATLLKFNMLAGPFLIIVVISFDLLIKAVKHLGIGTSYAVFTGIGVVGMVLLDIIWFKESISFLKLCLVLCLVLFIFGLKISSKNEGGSS